ncbi:ATP-binding region ATPase domain protein [Planctopirus limnophila DSM 3776]|uniref:DNA topoisomerase (ATP-hydrolyzing) n=1 Tax=Planctopirus limnophila (strain ATCC 43296 / DSM 3776 / IFAM 1008 / Mu 290) TaxID=521674 RepID=D5SVL8_PLAL2|nr:ATP-binding protein [Planctopirus limnophila]ADG69378.1 ATP-binding region ATPase domain protein [Planctopirus limnophila DSM 3776]
MDFTDLEAIRKRPAMYVGSTDVNGLHHLFNELLDNAIDQYLANQATYVEVHTSGEILEFTDDGPGLPFEKPGPHSGSLADYYLTHIRLDTPTADNHTPHIHLSGWGCGLRIITALTETCEVTSSRNHLAWKQSFSRGISNGPPHIVGHTSERGTTFRLSIDRDLFSGDWCQHRMNQRLIEAAHLFPGLLVKSQGLHFKTLRGLADLAANVAHEKNSPNPDRIWWFNAVFEDFHLQAAIAGTDSETEWKSFANGNLTIENGTHLTALQRVIEACNLRPAAAFIHVIISNPRFSGPTRSKLDVPEIISPIYEALYPSLKSFITEEVI